MGKHEQLLSKLRSKDGRGERMSNGVLITLIICITIVTVCLFGGKKK